MRPQGSQKWHLDRAGMITASRMNDVLAKPGSAQFERYAQEIREGIELKRRIEQGEDTQIPEGRSNVAMQWGKRYESFARAEYEWRTDTDVEVPEFLVHPEFPFFGASPDGLILQRVGGIEIKCPYNADNHALTLVSGTPERHLPQVHSVMMVAGLEFLDFISFDPRRSDNGRFYTQTIDRSGVWDSRIKDAVCNMWEYVTKEKKQTRPTPVIF